MSETVDHPGPLTPYDIGSIALVVLGVVATFPATWWVLDRLDNEGDWIVDPDYAIHPPNIDPGHAHTIGVISLLAVAIAAAVLTAMIRSGRWRPCALGLVLSATLAFTYAGLAAQVMTAPVVGANIGAGILLLCAFPVGVCVILFTTVASRACRTSIEQTPAVDLSP